jgi:hypothetical protein
MGFWVEADHKLDCGVAPRLFGFGAPAGVRIRDSMKINTQRISSQRNN